MQARTQILERGSKGAKLYLLRLRGGPPEPLKGLGHIIFFAVETNCDFPAWMTTQPALYYLSETLLQGRPGLQVPPDGRAAKQLNAIGIGGWRPTTISSHVPHTLLYKL